MKMSEAPTIVDLDVDLIHPRRYARRLTQKRIGQLCQSIKGIGLQVPIIVRAIGGGEGTSKKFEILAGHHRYAACRALNKRTIPCIIQSVNDLRAELISIDENLCRENLTPAQEAAAIKRRKEIYEALHPETKRGASRQIGDTVKATRFTETTAKSSPASQNGTSSVLRGVGKRSVQSSWTCLLVLHWTKALNSTH